jgi:ABC-type multidrug transport system ATPase subunit
MMALMGPSGAGKTTLLNALAHRHAGSIGGRILVNGRELPLATHRVISTYVEQEDVLMGSLTTLETLRFAAELTISRFAVFHLN